MTASPKLTPSPQPLFAQGGESELVRAEQGSKPRHMHEGGIAVVNVHLDASTCGDSKFYLRICSRGHSYCHGCSRFGSGRYGRGHFTQAHPGPSTPVRPGGESELGREEQGSESRRMHKSVFAIDDVHMCASFCGYSNFHVCTCFRGDSYCHGCVSFQRNCQNRGGPPSRDLSSLTLCRE